MRTAQPDGAHVEFFRGIAQPDRRQGRPGDDAGGLLELLDVLDPDREPGRLTLIHRFGAGAGRQLPAAAGRGRAASGDRCCGAATRCTATPRPPPAGIKTRRFEDILSRARAGLRDPRARLGGAPRRRPLRAHRRGRHRVIARRSAARAGSPRRGRPRARLPLAGRPAPELRAGARDGDADRAASTATAASSCRISPRCCGTSPSSPPCSPSVAWPSTPPRASTTRRGCCSPSRGVRWWARRCSSGCRSPAWRSGCRGFGCRSGATWRGYARRSGPSGRQWRVVASCSCRASSTCFSPRWPPPGRLPPCVTPATLYLLPISLFAMSVAASELPELSRLDGEGDTPAAWRG
jgi:hypothetical protein